MKTVHIVNSNTQYNKLMINLGYNVVEEQDASIILFTGGEDVTPQMYHHPQHPRTYNNIWRDCKEKEIFDLHKGKKHFVGICRGGQFLNVMHGGTMIQHCTRHAISGTHVVTDYDGEEYRCSSTHHQMMLPHEDGVLMAYANLGGTKEMWDGHEFIITKTPVDTESVLYEHGDKKTLCFQPHPEFFHHDMEHDCVRLFRKLLDQLGD